MTLPLDHPKKGNKAVVRKLHFQIFDLLARKCLPHWRWAYINGAPPLGYGGRKCWPDFILQSPIRTCLLQLPTSNGSMSQDRSEIAAFLMKAGCGYGLAHDFDDAVTMLRDWGCVQ